MAGGEAYQIADVIHVAFVVIVVFSEQRRLEAGDLLQQCFVGGLFQTLPAHVSELRRPREGRATHVRVWKLADGLVGEQRLPEHAIGDQDTDGAHRGHGAPKVPAVVDVVVAFAATTRGEWRINRRG